MRVVGGMVPRVEQNLPLDIDALLEQVRQLTGAGGGQRFEFLPALAALVDSLNSEASLSPTGRRLTRADLVGSLAAQVRLDRQLTDQPRIAEVPINEPIFVVGLPRTGTTLLHNLLALHPQARALRLWELRHPASDRVSGSRANLVQETYRWVEEYFRLAPGMRAIHDMSALAPDECYRLLSHAFQSLVFDCGYRVPTYAKWLTNQDLVPAYELYRLQLRHLLWRAPGERPVLKCPFHVWHLDVLAHVYPDARLVHLHRRPEEVLGSLCSLSVTARRLRSDEADPHEVGRTWRTHVSDVLDELPVTRTRIGLPALDINYTELVADPLGTAARITAFGGLSWSGKYERRVHDYLSAHPRHQYGVHRYTLADFGLDWDSVATSWPEYRRRFGVCDQRLAGH